MIDLSPAGLAGAAVGTVVAALVYRPIVGFAEHAFRSRDASASGGERDKTFEGEMSMLRRLVLAADIAVLGGAGYWLGEVIGG